MIKTLTVNPSDVFSMEDAPRPFWVAHQPDADGHTSHARHGYHSAYAKEADTPKWVAFDLGESRSVNTVTLYPVFPLFEEGCKEEWRAGGLYFPRAVRIECANSPDFADVRTVAEWRDAVERRESDFDAEGVFLGWFHACNTSAV